VTLRDAASDTALTCTITGTGGGAATDCQDVTHSVNVAKNDLIDWKVVTTGTYVATPTVTISSANGTSGVGVTSITCGTGLTGGTITTTGTCAVAAQPLTIGSSTGNTFSAPSGFFVCSSTCTVTPPVPAAGYQFCVWNGNNVSTVITLGALGSSSFYQNTARTAYGTAGTGTLTSGGATGDLACIVGVDATHYQTVSFSGTWTAS
jgi:hypothetical protein